MAATRSERDALGPIAVPEAAYWGAQTQRALENFRISGVRFPRRFLWALGLIKGCAAEANRELGELEPRIAGAVIAAAAEVERGELDAEFPLDVFQTGSGTSTNMNANEVIAARASERLAGTRAGRLVHPNDHVNRSQSSNDVMPSALHVAAREAIERELVPALARLRAALAAKASAFDGVVKIGRTHLQDATPVRLGQEFAGWAAQVAHGERRARQAADALAELALGGTAVGTGLNAPHGFAARAIAGISARTGRAYREAGDHFEAQGARDAAVEASGALRTIACSLAKIANDVRLLAMGPRCGLAELQLPAVQPGSSIMPGKVNPVMCEALVMVAGQVVGNDAAVAFGGLGGQLELNACLPLVARNLLESIEILAAGARAFAERCVEGIEADEARVRALVERSLAMATALAPRIGYDAAAAIAKEAFATDRTVREVARERSGLPPDDLDRLLDPRRQTEGA
jgi:fumarate hydratase class II